MQDTDVYEALPNVYFRPKGNHTSPPLHCRMLRTRARVVSRDQKNLTIVHIALPMPGYENIEFYEWVPGWSIANDNMREDTPHSGRPVDVAILAEMFEVLMTSGRALSQELRAYGGSRLYLYTVPVVAVRVDKMWFEPRIPLRAPSIEK